MKIEGFPQDQRPTVHEKVIKDVPDPSRKGRTIATSEYRSAELSSLDKTTGSVGKVQNLLFGYKDPSSRFVPPQPRAAADELNKFLKPRVEAAVNSGYAAIKQQWALSEFQGILENAYINKRGVGDLTKIEFLNALNAPGTLTSTLFEGKANEVVLKCVTGARTVAHYFESVQSSLSERRQIAASSPLLDAAYAIDAIQFEYEGDDPRPVVTLIQIKSSKQDPSKMADIVAKHRAYVSEMPEARAKLEGVEVERKLEAHLPKFEDFGIDERNKVFEFLMEHTDDVWTGEGATIESVETEYDTSDTPKALPTLIDFIALVKNKSLFKKVLDSVDPMLSAELEVSASRFIGWARDLALDPEHVHQMYGSLAPGSALNAREYRSRIVWRDPSRPSFVQDPDVTL